MTTYNKRPPHNRQNDVLPVIILLSVVLIIILTAVIAILSKSEKKLGNAIHKVEYAEYVYQYAEEFSVDPNLVFAIIKNESNFDPYAESHVGAKGLMQLMPDTFTWLQTYKYGEVSLDEDFLFDPATNIKYGCIFLQFLTEKYTVTSTAVAAYNAGFGIVDTWLEDTNYSSDGETLSYIPYSETANYVEKVMNSKRYYENNIVTGDNTTDNDISQE